MNPKHRTYYRKYSELSCYMSEIYYINKISTATPNMSDVPELNRPMPNITLLYFPRKYELKPLRARSYFE